MSAAVFVISGRAGVGKTSFVERLIPHLKAAGLCVATIKTSSTTFVPGYPATDIHKHIQAGADRSTLAQQGGTFVFLPAQESFSTLLENERRNCQVLLLEGQPYGDFPVIEVVRVGAPKLPDCEVWLTVTDRPVGRALEVESAEEAARHLLEHMEHGSAQDQPPAVH